MSRKNVYFDKAEWEAIRLAAYQRFTVDRDTPRALARVVDAERCDLVQSVYGDPRSALDQRGCPRTQSPALRSPPTPGAIVL